MKQQIRDFREKIGGNWNSISKKNKFLYSGLFVFVILALSLTIYFVSKPDYVPLFNNQLSQQEIGEIKAELDRQGFADYRLENNGTSITVPAKEAPNLLVSLAAKGLPKTGTISFSEMTKDLKFGATDRQLDAMEKEALQGQVADLLTHVSGVKSAQVVISTPEESLFVRPEEKGKATASVVVELEPGVELEPKQIQTMYHLVSKSIPNLPKENIIMTDQSGQGLDTSQDTLLTDNYNKQRKIQNDVEMDIQRDLQQMLGTIMGHDKVMIQAFVRLNFDQVKTEENLVEPVNKETNEGIVISAEKISKTYKGQDNSTGVTGTGETDIPGYTAEGAAQGTTSEELENRVNYEVNRITKNIVQSPYKIEDLTINVGVEPPDPKDPNSLTDATKANIEQMLSNVVRTALSDNPNLTDQNIASRITVFPREFSGKVQTAKAEAKTAQLSKWWMFALAGAGALLLIALIIFLIARRRRKLEEEVEEQDPFPLLPPREVRAKEELEIEEEKAAIKNEIEQMAQHQPEVFVGLLRNWLS
ncbi:flagellar basal-body MS-ring/collar protein FliF [Neobacillus sp. 114]|uniref:flagellar basal-body MS-ring/collar protein FliF n=1 Tax=Neobacillus sp. 114 TaxID=3048535 RepID=UPI0024C26B26|nr:flagellar basal-body MS-ring/collar protein FliF [Neobacillus sp. 114]